MNTEIIIATLGIVSTVLVGIWGIRYASKHKMKTQLLFIEHNCISLFRSIVKNLEEIEIKYKDKTIEQNLILFKGTFFNSGNTDIDHSIIHKPLTVELPHYFNWKKAKIIDKSEDVVIENKIEKNQLILDWDILKENEYFTFDSVIEYKPDSEQNRDNDITSNEYDITRQLSRNIKFSHRITNLSSVSKEKFPSKPMGFWGIVFLSIYVLVFVGLFSYLSVGQFVFPEYDVYHEINQDSTTIFAKLQASDKDKIELKNNKEEWIVTGEELSRIIGTKIEISKQGIKYWSLSIFGLFTIIMFLGLIFFIIEEMNTKRLYKKIKVIAEKHSNTQFGGYYGGRRSRIFPFR